MIQFSHTYMSFVRCLCALLSRLRINDYVTSTAAWAGSYYTILVVSQINV